MQDSHKTVNADETLAEIISTIWNSKLLIISITFIGIFITLFLAIYTPNIYKSTAVLLPISSDNSLSSKIGASPLTSLVGISIPSNTADKSQEAIRRLNSLDFFSKSFLPEINLKDLMALKRWDADNNILIYNSKIYDDNKNVWIKNKPSSQEAFEVYKQIINIKEDTKTPFIEISINHLSPLLAKEWLEIIIKNINESIRSYDEKATLDYLNFLSNYYENSKKQSMRDVISKLQESQMQSLMMASRKSNDYVFKFIDPPVVPEFKFWPNRFIIVCIGSILSFVIALLLVLVINYRHNLIKTLVKQ
jgi:capsule polysaccharide export protein KpsE/RkpR